jgi:hypothetical protein
MAMSDEGKVRAEKAAAEYDAHLEQTEDRLEAAAEKDEASFKEQTAGAKARLEQAEDRLEAAARKADASARQHRT